MKSIQSLILVLLVIMANSSFQNAYACSGYKLTLGNKTILGSNEDAWRITPHIWFEQGQEKVAYGAVFTGSRYDGANGYAPQSGMNEMGLAFERLASYYPQSAKMADKKPITNPTKYLKDILHHCKTVEEAKEYISLYDYSYFIEDVFLYVDRSGKYLVVEPYQLTIGDDPSFVISNFCPSITSPQKAAKLERYRNGLAFLRNKIDTSLAFCTALSDTMHVCRDKIGDGTLLTSIWDLDRGVVNLYFYHQYDKCVQFDLKAELEKGDHQLAIETLFPLNTEFEQLRHYKTPKSDIRVGIFIMAAAALFLFSFLFLLIPYFRRKDLGKYAYILLLYSLLDLILLYYLYVLVTNINVFYFAAPYKDSMNVLVSISSYIPFLLLMVIIPFVIINYRLFKEKNWGWFTKALLTLNNLVYIVLLLFFVYWRFYDVF